MGDFSKKQKREKFMALIYKLSQKTGYGIHFRKSGKEKFFFWYFSHNFWFEVYKVCLNQTWELNFSLNFIFNFNFFFFLFEFFFFFSCCEKEKRIALFITITGFL